MVGKIGQLFFDKGLYVYFGSALGDGASSIEGRIRRHIKNNKKIFWHIDYLLKKSEARLLYAIYSTTNADIECEIVKNAEKFLNIVYSRKKFGSSDCGCMSHLLKARKEFVKEDLVKDLKKIYVELGLSPMVIDLNKESREM